MGKNTKHLMERYQEVAEEDFNNIAAGITDRKMLMGYMALRERTEAALITSVAGVLIDKKIDNAMYRVHSEISSGYHEVIVLQNRLDVMDKAIAELTAKLEVDAMELEGQMALFDIDDENTESVDEMLLTHAQGTDD